MSVCVIDGCRKIVSGGNRTCSMEHEEMHKSLICVLPGCNQVLKSVYRACSKEHEQKFSRMKAEKKVEVKDKVKGSYVCAVPGCNVSRSSGYRTCTQAHGKLFSEMHEKVIENIIKVEGKCPICDEPISKDYGMGMACNHPEHISMVLAEKIIGGQTPPALTVVKASVREEVEALVADSKRINKEHIARGTFCRDCNKNRRGKEMCSIDCLYLGCENQVGHKMVGCCLCHHNAIRAAVASASK